MGQYKPAGQLVRQGGKPELLFIGALYCPFCASERWAIVKALNRFGTWSNLHSSESKGGAGGFGTISTFDLMNAHYSSRYVAFVSRDTEDRDNNPLQPLSSEQQPLLNRYDPTGGIAMVLAADHVMVGAGFLPCAIDGKSFRDAQLGIQRGASATYVHDINAESNLITAYLCRADGMQPAAACGTPVVKHILTAVTSRWCSARSTAGRGT